MSQQETIIGKLKLLPRHSGETLEDQCKRVYNEKYKQMDEPEDYNDSWEEQLYDRGYGEIVIYKGDLYEVISRKDMNGYDIFEMSKADNGTYNFTLSYYNGGCGFGEAIEYAFNNMKEEQ